MLQVGLCKFTDQTPEKLWAQETLSPQLELNLNKIQYRVPKPTSVYGLCRTSTSDVWLARLSLYVGTWVLIVVVSHNQPCSSETGSLNRKWTSTPRSGSEVFSKFKVAPTITFRLHLETINHLRCYFTTNHYPSTH